MADARRNVEQSQRALNSLRDGQKDRLKRFGSNVPDLLRNVETAVRRGRFHKPPKGPIGKILCYFTWDGCLYSAARIIQDCPGS